MSDNRNKFLDRDTFDAIVTGMETARTQTITAKDQAETAAGTATTKAGEAVGSATAAGNSATAASGSATTASDAATAASGSANTATTQAGIATTKAGEADASATAASGSATAAQGFRNEAESFRDQASASAQAAADSAGIAVQGIHVIGRLALVADLPVSPTTGDAYVIEVSGSDKIYVWDGTAWINFDVGSGTSWGQISGTLSSQTDLNNALGERVARGEYGSAPIKESPHNDDSFLYSDSQAAGVLKRFSWENLKTILGTVFVSFTDIVNDLTTGGVAVPGSAENDKTLQDTKVAKAGDTMTGLLRATAGINFEASGGDTLQDYEIGTWTPVFQTSNANLSGASYNYSMRQYMRIGSYVHVWARFNTTSISSVGTGNVQIHGLPFTASSDMVESAVHVAFAVGYNTIAPESARIISNTSTLELLETAYATTTLFNLGADRLLTGSGNNISLYAVYKIA